MAQATSDSSGLAVIRDPTPALIDICFVHGLGGGRVSTWSTGDGSWPEKGGIFWPGDLLHKDIKNARILTWGYDADPVRFWSRTSKNLIEDHARAMLEDLRILRSESQTVERPIIFVAHSLGGAVCANSLMIDANEHPSAENKIADPTGGIAFMGTPFEGSDKTKWLHKAQKITKIIHGGQPTENLASQLSTGTVALAAIGNHFPGWLRGRKETPKSEIRVMCFFGEYESIIGEVVSKDSACIDGFDQLAIGADHVGMCKYSSDEDDNYKKVLGVLKKWV